MVVLRMRMKKRKSLLWKHSTMRKMMTTKKRTIRTMSDGEVRVQQARLGQARLVYYAMLCYDCRWCAFVLVLGLNGLQQQPLSNSFLCYQRYLLISFDMR
jgi:hypothetical protein